MSTVYDPQLRRTTLVVPCRYCGLQVYWSLSERSRKRTAYNLVEGQPTRDQHRLVCPGRAGPSARAARKQLA